MLSGKLKHNRHGCAPGAVRNDCVVLVLNLNLKYEKRAFLKPRTCDLMFVNVLIIDTQRPTSSELGS